MVLLDHDFHSQLDLIQYAVEAPGYFILSHVHLRHRFDHTAFTPMQAVASDSVLRLGWMV